MAINKDIVPRETPPLVKVGPIEIEVNVFERRLANMTREEIHQLMELLAEYDVMLKK